MSKRIMNVLLSMLIGATALAGCAMFGDGIPPEQLGNYALIVSRISERGQNMDTMPSSQQGMDTTAYVSWINGKHAMPARAMMNVLPGEYEFQVELGCSNSATCRPSKAYKLVVKAGYRYVLTPTAVYVSDRTVPRSNAEEKLYQPQ